ncbi:MAG: GH3 auxin-responsive promoter family protein, partial [Cyclobacteriaceae bacterium]|nr:GH3 auxin-responsive promoter family protein [Cyclobacteriaceae bacterium]
MKKRMHQIALFRKYPNEVQDELFQKLIETARDTQFGREHNFASINNVQQFRENVPVRNYEQLFPYIEKLLKGEQQILWPSEVSWFAKSSGTTNDRSKFIPVTSEALEDCHFKGGKDMISIYLDNYPDSKII